MQHYNEKRSITNCNWVSPRHDHEEVVLQGRMSAGRNGTWFNLNGPHDVLMAEVRIVTPGGVHNLTLLDDTRHIGTVRFWNDFYKPTLMEQRLIDTWRCDTKIPTSSYWCPRSHRSIKEGKTCTGSAKAVVDLSDPPRGEV